MILKICPKFQVLGFHFSEVDEMLYEHWAKLLNEKTFPIQSMSNTIKCIHKMFAVKNFGISCLALIFISFGRSIQFHGLVAGCSELVDMGLIPTAYRKSLLPLGHFVWHWAYQWTDMLAIYIAALSIIFSFQNFVLHWQGFKSLQGHPTWNLARGPD